MALSSRAVDVLLAVDPDITSHFRRTLIPDEAYIHTVLLNEPGLNVKEGRSTYAPWEHFGRLPHLVLREEDLPAVIASQAPFARKIGEGALAEVTVTLNELCQRGESEAPDEGQVR